MSTSLLRPAPAFSTGSTAQTLGVSALGASASLASENVFRFENGGPTLSDQEIVRRVQCGERELFGELHTRHYEKVLNYVLRSIWQRETAQDVAGEAWIRALGAIDRFEVREDTSVVGWILRIAANLITDYRRRLGPETQSFEDETDFGAPQFIVPGTEREFWRRERARAISSALEDLTESDRQIIALSHREGYSGAQIAQILGKPSTSAVTSHLHRAMNHLRDKLQTAGWEE